MGRRSHTRALNVWMNGQLVGRWAIGRGGGSEFLYSDSWLASPATRPLSLSLPVPLDRQALKGPQVEFYFDNLLPDSEPIRTRVQQRFRTGSKSAFDLLEAIGRDCVGAVQLLPEGKEPEGVNVIRGEPLSEEQIEQRLIAAVTPGGAGIGRDEDAEHFRISVAGAQEKTAFLRHEGHWCQPLGATPTTHIFKLPLGRVGNMQADMRTSVENEWLCAKLAHTFGLPVARCDIARFGTQKVLVVERFDRALSLDRSHWLRLPQEDFCQALGAPASAKYESDGGPGIREIAKLLATSEDPAGAGECFMTSQVLFWLLAATDGHAKNFSIFLLPEGRYRMTPLYDILSAWPVIGRGPNHIDYKKASLAMSLFGKNRHRKLADIQRRHFISTAQITGLAPKMPQILERIKACVPQVIETVGVQLPERFPEEVFEAITHGLLRSTQQLLRAA